MSVEEDLSLEAKARAWLDMAQTKWRLQTMQHRSRFNPKTGEYRQLPTRVRRFLNGTPVSMKARVLEILKESAPYSCPVFDLETGDMEYVPTNTYIRKDGPELTSGGADATYTIVQDLKLLDEAGDTFGMRDESSCAQVGEAEWHWDEPDVVDCPDGSQGVSYQVANVSRDRETDLFSYVVRKVQALTVHVPPHVVACGTRSRVTVESWDNVYGEPGSFRWDPVNGGSAAIAVPEPCDQPDGTSVKVSANRNADCTYRVEVERTEAVTGVGMYYSQHDRYRSEAGERTFNAFAPLPRQGVEYDHGLVTRCQSERNEDGTWTNDVNTTLERPVPESTVEERRTPRGTTRTRVDTNVAEPASGISSEFGSWKCTKTPGGLFTNEYVEHVRRIVDNLGLVCTDTAFLKTHESQGSASSVPSSGHVPPAADGLVTTWNYDTDAEGLVTRRVRTEQEHTVEYAVRRRTWGWLGSTSGYVHRSVTAAVANAILASGGAGTSVEVRMTNGGLFDVEVQTFLRRAGQRLGFECQKTVYQHVHEDVTSADAVGAEARDAGGGRTYRKSFVVDASTGAVTQRETVTTELEVPESRRVVRVTPRGKTVRTTRSNSPSRPADASAPGRTTEFEVTPGGRFNVTLEETTPSQDRLETGCAKDVFEEADSEMRTSLSRGPEHTTGGSGGVYGEASSRQGEDGLWENRTVVHTEGHAVDNGVDVVVTARGKRRTVKTKSTEAPAEPGADEAGRALRTSRTRGGRYDVEDTTTTPREADSEVGCSKDLFQHSHTEGATRASREADDVEATADGSGVYRERRQRLGDDGLWGVEDVEHTELPVQRQRVEVRVTRHGKVKRTTDVQVDDSGAEPQATAADVGKEKVVEKTRGGKRNVTVTEVTPLREQVQEECSQDAFLHTHSVTRGADGNTLSGDDVPEAGGGVYREKSLVLNDVGVWEERAVDHEEIEETPNTVNYQDAFGARQTTFFMNGDDRFDAKEFSPERLIRSVEQEMTRGRQYSARVTSETPQEVDSGWLHFEKSTDRGLAIYYDFIVFRNATMAQVKGWIRHLETINYTGWEGSFANHPSISIAPNRFRLWDGSLSVTTTFTPKAWASGGSHRGDNWETPDVMIKSVNFVPLSKDKLLKIVTTETHRRGGGVGKGRMNDVLKGTMIKGSQFSYHPSGQAFSYDIITAIETKSKILDMQTDVDGQTIWDGGDL